MINITNPNEEPVAGDIVETYASGLTSRFAYSAPLTEAEEARIWRNAELTDTDWIVSITDHPQHAGYLAYRVALRGWPTAVDSDDAALFPDTKPELSTD